MEQNKNSIFIEIKRKFSTLEVLNRELEQMGGIGTSRAIGSYGTTGLTPHSGLRRHEEELLLPLIIGLEPVDRDFRSKVELFYTEINTRVPATGLKLEIGLRDNDKPLAKDNMPINIGDYIKYRHLNECPYVAKSEKEGLSSSLYTFYVVDKKAKLKTDLSKSTMEDDAMSIFITNKDNADKVEMFLELMSTKLNENKGLSPEDKILKLKKLLQADPAKFINVSKDKNQETKYFIKQCKSANILRSVGHSVLDSSTGLPIGNTEEEAVLYLNDNANLKHKGILEASLKEYKLKHSV